MGDVVGEAVVWALAVAVVAVVAVLKTTKFWNNENNWFSYVVIE